MRSILYTLGSPILHSEPNETEKKDLKKQYKIPSSAEFKYTVNFKPTVMLKDIILPNGLKFTPCAIEPAILYGLFLDAFPTHCPIPNYNPCMTTQFGQPWKIE